MDGNDMATSNDALLQNLNDFKIKNAEDMGSMGGDLRVLTNEVRTLNDSLKTNLAIVATKQELQTAQKEAEEEHKKIWLAINEIKTSAKWWVGTVVAVCGVIAATIAVFVK